MMKRKEKIQFESPERVNRIVEGTKIVGDLIADSNIRIDGEVIGNVSTSSKVVLGESGLIKGNLLCQDADVEGKIEGKIAVESLLVLREKARIVGDIQTGKLHVEEGAVFVGKCNMGGVPPVDHKVEVNTVKTDEDIIY